MFPIARTLAAALLPALVAVSRVPVSLEHGWTVSEDGRQASVELALGQAVTNRPLGLEVGGVVEGDVLLFDGAPLSSARIERRFGGARRFDVVLAIPPAATTPGRHVLSARLAERGAGEPAFSESPRLSSLDELLSARAARNVPQLAAAVATASFAVVALLFFARDPRRRDLGLYALFALGVSLFLASALPVAARAPGAVERGLAALAFLLPSTGYLFVLRFLSLPVPAYRRALLALPGVGLLLVFAQPSAERAIDALTAATLLGLGGELLVALARRRRAEPDTPLLFLGTAALLLAVLVDAARAHGALATSARVSFVGPAFLLFTALLLVAVADEGKRLLVRATTDPLTGVLNREEFVRRANAELLRAERNGTTLALAMLDVDHFKSFNDRFGHQAGDRVLVATAQTIAAAVRGLDVVGRYGGEEFIVLLVNAAEASARDAVERIRGAVGELEPPVVPERVTASAGVSLHNALFERTTLAALVKRADGALYAAKRAGRDRTLVEEARVASPRTAAEVRYR